MSRSRTPVHWDGGSVKSVAPIELFDFVCARAGGPGGPGTKAERMELGSHVPRLACKAWIGIWNDPLVWCGKLKTPVPSPIPLSTTCFPPLSGSLIARPRRGRCSTRLRCRAMRLGKLVLAMPDFSVGTVLGRLVPGTEGLGTTSINLQRALCAHGHCA